MKKVLFVCHGNICRSPMAEAVFRHMLEERGLGERFAVDSAAVSAEEIGNPVYPEANRTLVAHGLPASNHHAWQLTRADYDRYDFFIGMDQENIYRMRQIFGGDSQRKVGLLLAYTEHPREVEDPWYTGRFDRVFDLITQGCQALLETLLADEAGQA
jgi:protein-tyrosine phosphatase